MPLESLVPMVETVEAWIKMMMIVVMMLMMRRRILEVFEVDVMVVMMLWRYHY